LEIVAQVIMGSFQQKWKIHQPSLAFFGGVPRGRKRKDAMP